MKGPTWPLIHHADLLVLRDRIVALIGADNLTAARDLLIEMILLIDKETGTDSGWRPVVPRRRLPIPRGFPAPARA